MTLATAVRDTVVAESEATPLVFTETPTNLRAPYRSSFSGNPDYYVLVHTVDITLSDHSPNVWQLVGRVVQAKASANHNGYWYTDALGRGDRAYFTGPEVCPDPVDTHLYRVYMQDRTSYLCYRNGGRWDIVRGAGLEPHPYENDILAEEPVLWYEVVDVTATETTADAGVSNEGTEPAAEPAADLSVWLEAIGAGLVSNPPELVREGEWVDGEMYVNVNSDTHSRHAIVAMKAFGVDTPVPTGVFNIHYGYADPATRNTQIAAGEGSHWAKMRHNPPTHPPMSIATQRRIVEKWNKDTTEMRRSFWKTNTALNELASEQAWCGEYERVMTRLEMRGRDTKYKGTLRDVRVQVSLHSRTDAAKEAMQGLADMLKVPTVYSAAVTVEIPELEVEVMSRSSNAADYMSTSQVMEAVSRHIEASGGTSEAIDISHNGYLETYDSSDTQWEPVDDSENVDLSDLPAPPEEVPLESAPLAG